MRLCIYEDSRAPWLEPVSLTRPAFSLWCGAERLFERYLRQFSPYEVGYWVRPNLADLWRLEQPDSPVNDLAWLRQAQTVWLNGRWLPPRCLDLDITAPHIGMIGEQIAYAVTPIGWTPAEHDLESGLNEWKERLPIRLVGGSMAAYLWDLIDHNGACLTHDSQWFREQHGHGSLPGHLGIEGPADQFIAASDSLIEPFVVADTRSGPVLVDQGAVVHSFTRLEGPCYVGRESWIVGAKIRANTTIGPGCRIGGEVEASIIQGFTNKYHEGFLGHSYIGEWVNLAAATQTSDLRNDYGEVTVTVRGQRIATAHTKVGSFIGDHTKTGLAALLNTGSMVGAFANLLPSGSYLPLVIPSFCLVRDGLLREQRDLRKLFRTAAQVMERRGHYLTSAHLDLYYDLFDATAKSRQEAFLLEEVRSQSSVVRSPLSVVRCWSDRATN